MREIMVQRGVLRALAKASPAHKSGQQQIARMLKNRKVLDRERSEKKCDE